MGFTQNSTTSARLARSDFAERSCGAAQRWALEAGYREKATVAEWPCGSLNLGLFRVSLCSPGVVPMVLYSGLIMLLLAGDRRWN